MAYSEWKYPNGLNIITEDMPSMASVTVGFFVLSGAGHESLEEIGIAHALEHLLFRGSLLYPKGTMSPEFTQLTGTMNAFTTWEYTCFYSRSTPEVLSDAFLPLMDMIRQPLLREEDFNLEQNIIRRELSRQLEEPRSRLTHALHQSVYPGRLGKLLIGHDEDILQLKAPDLREFHKRHYIPSNILLVISGRLEKCIGLDSCLQALEDWDESIIPVELEQPLIAQPEVVNLTQKHSELCYSLWAWSLPPLEDKEHYAVHLLCTLLGDDNYIGSRLYNKIVAPGFAQQITCVYTVLGGKGLFKIYGLTSAPQLEWIREKMLVELQQIKAGMITPREYNRAKQKVKTQMALDASGSHSRSVSIAQAWMRHKRMVPLSELLALIDQISIDDLQNIIEQYFSGREFFEIYG
ncbi:M16 family metallopeptidase [Paenibacillus silagei]|uniref:Zn-dependent peptidase n=1 Tax=Paenibacillus silagei TaxID=1670801 RepID=A0ABS4NK41_9BACL|nr:pitrilysin family protein [Paenibacillus silagei]MBP2110418.1 putative Zn-dependent peptidase [Paenibacillus silagei]